MFKDSLKLLLPVFKRAWGWLLFAALLEEFFGWSTMQILDMYQVKESVALYAGGANLLFSLGMASLSVIVLSHMIQDEMKGRRPPHHTPMMTALRDNLRDVFIESMRAFLPVILWGLVFIIPGVVVAIRLYFVPFVAQFDQEYKKGAVDALQRSRDLVHGRFWRVTLLLIFIGVLSIVPALLLMGVKLATQPAAFGALLLASMLAELFGGIVMFKMYLDLSKTLKAGN